MRRSRGGYSWLDGYYIFNGGNWLQIVNSTAPNSGQITDTQAFDGAVGTWSCASSDCSSIATNVTGQNQNALGSDNIAISVETTPDQLQVCAQRQIISFTALPGLQNLHISTTSSFYIPLTGTATTVLGCPNQPGGPPCTYQSANGSIVVESQRVNAKTTTKVSYSSSGFCAFPLLATLLVGVIELGNLLQSSDNAQNAADAAALSAAGYLATNHPDPMVIHSLPITCFTTSGNVVSCKCHVDSADKVTHCADYSWLEGYSLYKGDP